MDPILMEYLRRVALIVIGDIVGFVLGGLVIWAIVKFRHWLYWGDGRWVGARRQQLGAIFLGTYRR